jgi:hypothetical protein
MSFFEEIPKPEFQVEMRPHRQPEWAGPPENMVGSTVPVDLVLANTGDVAVVLGGMTAYPTGVLFEIEILRRTFEGEEADPFAMRFHHTRPGGFRIGVELPGGHRLGADRGGDTSTAMLSPQGGGGGGLSYRMDFWLWPLPGEGTLRVACEWPDQGLGETVCDLDTAPIRAAAARAVELWPDDRPVDEDDDDEW